MTEDPILKLAVHLDRHHSRAQAFFSTAALRALLDRLADSNRDLEKVTKERDNLEAIFRARPTGTRSQRESQLEKEVERLTKDRDAIKMQLDLYVSEVEKLRSYEQLHIQNLERLRVRNEALEAQVKRLIAKEGERIGRELREGETRDMIVERLNKRLDEPLPEPRKDANGNLIPWPESADYFMAFDPANPDVPTD